MGPHIRAGEKFEKERAAEKNCYGLTATSNTQPPLHQLGLSREEEELGMKEADKLSLGSGVVCGTCFSFCL